MNNTGIFINTNNSIDNILYIADIPKETIEEDIKAFFNNHKMTHCKLFQ
jgi:hypothetical protein